MKRILFATMPFDARIDYCRLGVDLRTEKPSARAITRGVKRVLGDERIRERVGALRAEFDAYDPLTLVAQEVASL